MEGKRKAYRADGITVYFEPRRCIHAERCVHGLPAVFDRDRRPWIVPDGAPPDQIVRIVHGCPTGALTYERTDGGGSEPIPPGNDVEVTVVRDGPLYVRGNLEFRRKDGSVFARETRVALCRCGQSKHKPYCDNTHAEIEWHDG